MLAVHVVVEGEAVGGAVGVDVKGGRQETGLVPVLTGSRRLDVHVETWNHMNRRLSHDLLHYRGPSHDQSSDTLACHIDGCLSYH